MLDAGEDVRFVVAERASRPGRAVPVRTFSISPCWRRPAVRRRHAVVHRGCAFLPKVIGQRRATTSWRRATHGETEPEAIILLGDFGGVRLIAEPVPGGVPAGTDVPLRAHRGHGPPAPLDADVDDIRPVAMSEFGADEIAGHHRLPPARGLPRRVRGLLAGDAVAAHRPARPRTRKPAPHRDARSTRGVLRAGTRGPASCCEPTATCPARLPTA